MIHTEAMSVKKDEPTLSASGVKARGWTDAMIRDLLGEPDATARNRHGASSPRVRLYRLARVEQAESSDGFAERLGKAKRRSDIGRQQAEGRREAWLERNTVPVGAERAAASGDSGFEFDDFQTEAMDAIDRGVSVLVSAPTGAGKTVIAEHAVDAALRTGMRAIYTTPIKALSNQKFRDFGELHGEHRVGLATGDQSVRTDASLMVMTTEVLRNMLYSDDAQNRLAMIDWVVLDEVHYLQDSYRGAVWEEILIRAPQHIKFVCLSATISNAEQFGAWLAERRGECEVVESRRRPVPLRDWHLVEDKKDATGLSSIRLAADNQAREDSAHLKSGARLRRGSSGSDPWDRYGYDDDWRFAKPSEIDVLRYLRDRRQLPTICFVFSRSGCDSAALKAARANLSLSTPDEQAQIRRIAEEHLMAVLDDEDAVALGARRWIDGLCDGVAAHHAGIAPVQKEIIERCFVSGLIKAVFATETMALGLNMPARSVVISSMTKWNGHDHDLLTPMQYRQIAGRAGRRGIDVEGHAISLWSQYVNYDTAAQIVVSGHFPLTSSFRLTYNFVANLMRRSTRTEADEIVRRSYAAFLSKKRWRSRLDEIVDILTRFGCARDWSLTERGEMLTSIYHENDALIATALDEGLLSGLDDGSLAGIISGMVYTPRRGDPDGYMPPRGNPARRNVAEIQRLAHDFIRAEADAGISLTAHTDTVCYQAAAAWANGLSFAAAMNRSDMSPGDFVRHMRIIIDVLRQIAECAEDSSLGRQALRVATRMRRGIVAAA